MAFRVVNRLEGEVGEQLVLLDSMTIERKFGWVFLYNTKRFLETNNVRDALAGNGPLLVDKRKATVLQLGTAFPLEQYLEHYERTGLVLGGAQDDL